MAKLFSLDFLGFRMAQKNLISRYYNVLPFIGCFLLANVSFGQSTLEVRTLKEEGKLDMQVNERVNVTFELNDSSGSNKR